VPHLDITLLPSYNAAPLAPLVALAKTLLVLRVTLCSLRRPADKGLEALGRLRRSTELRLATERGVDSEPAALYSTGLANLKLAQAVFARAPALRGNIAPRGAAPRNTLS
jgi:hypothetical protein